MIRFLLRRLLNYLVLLVLASFMAFCLASLTFHPLDSFIERHPQPPAEAIHAKAVELGLDKPIPIRYAEWAAGVVQGDFGTTVTGHPVSQELWSRVGVSLRLVVIGSLVGTVTGVVLGAWGAVRQYRLSDRVITVLSLIILSIPSFVLAGLLILAALRVNNLFGVRSSPTPGKPRRFRPAESGTNSSTALGTSCCRLSPWRWARPRASAVTSATRCWTCSARTSSGPRGPRA